MKQFHSGARPDRGCVFDIQRMSVHDGPGIRTTVFLKGCGLRCAWCHNPEGLSPTPQVAFTPDLCAACGHCFQQCPENAHLLEQGIHRLNRSRCIGCLACVETCCGSALEAVGREMSVEAVLAEVMRDAAYYEASGGGMTLSGGEPLAQFGFAERLLRGARARGLHTCLETSGFCVSRDITTLVPWVDLFLFDLKESDPDRHRIFTGQGNTIILDNLRRLDGAGAAITLRCVFIPEVNLRDDHIEAIAILARSLNTRPVIEIKGYHPLGEGKLQRLGLVRERLVEGGFSEMTPEQLERVADRLRQVGCARVRIL